MADEAAGPTMVTVSHPRVLPRAITVLVVISVTVNLVLAAAFVFLAIQQGNNSRAIHNSQVAACRTSNQIRLQDIAIWNRLLTVSPAQRAQQDQAARAEVRELEHLVAVKDTPVNCAAIYHVP